MDKRHREQLDDDLDVAEFIIAWVGGNCLAAFLAVYLLTTHGIL